MGISRGEFTAAKVTGPACSTSGGRAGPVTFAAVNYHREIPMGDTVELL